MHAILQTEQLARLFRDLDKTADAALRGATPHAQRLAWLLDRIRATDARSDSEFQQRLCRHLGVRGKLRTRKEALYELVEALKRTEAAEFEQVLGQVSLLTGQVEKSSASHLLALLDPGQPVIDRDLRELLPRYGFTVLGEAPPFDECLVYHRLLRELFAQILSTPAWRAVSVRIDRAFGTAAGAVPAVQKLGLLLSHARRPIALLPSNAAQQMPAVAPRPAAAVAAVETVVPGSSRLHLCR